MQYDPKKEVDREVCRCLGGLLGTCPLRLEESSVEEEVAWASRVIIILRKVLIALAGGRGQRWMDGHCARLCQYWIPACLPYVRCTIHACVYVGTQIVLVFVVPAATAAAA